MTDIEPGNQFIRIERSDASIEVMACRIDWSSPHTPIDNWEVVRQLPPHAPHDDIRQAIQTALQDREYFGLCDECGKTYPLGMMHHRGVCQGCASANHGIVY